MSESNFENAQSGFETGDEVAIVVGAATAVVPKSAIHKMKRQKSALKRKKKACEKAYPRTVFMILAFLAVYKLVLYYLDVYSDGVVCYILFTHDHRDWFYLSAGFLALPHSTAMVGIATYVWKEVDFWVYRPGAYAKGTDDWKKYAKRRARRRACIMHVETFRKRTNNRSKEGRKEGTYIVRLKRSLNIFEYESCK